MLPSGDKLYSNEDFADDDIAVLKCRIRVYAGAIIKHDKDALSLVAKLIELFNSSDLDFTVIKGTDTEAFSMKITISKEGMDFIIYKMGFEAYTFIIEIDGPAHSGIAIPVPAAVNLTSPADGAIDINPSDADLSWQAIAGMTYQLQISDAANFSNILFDQDKIKYNNFTLPDGILYADIIYYWRVRAYNSNGICGAWSSRSFTTVSTALEAETVALLARMVIQPDATRQNLINNLIKELKADGIWAKFDCFWMFAAHTNTNGEALLNWIKNANNCTLVNAPTFTVDRGIQCAVSGSKYINSNYNPFTNAVNYILNSASFGVYSRTNVGGAYLDIGSATAGFASNNFVGALFNSGFDIGGVNQNAYVNSQASVGSSLGLIAIRRTSNNTIAWFRRGSLIQAYSTQNSTAIINSNLFIGAINIAGTPTDISARQYSMAFVGGSLTDADIENLDFRLETFFDAIGARV